MKKVFVAICLAFLSLNFTQQLNAQSGSSAGDDPNKSYKVCLLQDIKSGHTDKPVIEQSFKNVAERYKHQGVLLHKVAYRLYLNNIYDKAKKQNQFIHEACGAVDLAIVFSNKQAKDKSKNDLPEANVQFGYVIIYDTNHKANQTDPDNSEQTLLEKTIKQGLDLLLQTNAQKSI